MLLLLDVHDVSSSRVSSVKFHTWQV